MKRWRYLLLLAFWIAGAAAAWAQSFDAYTDFSGIENPHGKWTYGWSDSLTGPLVVYSATSSFFGGYGWADGSTSDGQSAGLLPGGATPSFFTSGTMALSPGFSGQYSVCRFTVPTSGTYNIQASFLAPASFPTDDEVFILQNGGVLSDDLLQAGFEKNEGLNSVTLAAGDSIDVAIVGTHASSSLDLSSFSLTVSSVSPSFFSSVNLASDNAFFTSYARAGDHVILSFTTTAPIQTPAVSLAGKSGSDVTITSSGSNSYTASVTVDDSFPSGSVSFSIDAQDMMGQSQRAVGTLDDSGVSIVFDTPLIGTTFLPLTGYVTGAALPDLTGLVFATFDEVDLATFTQSPPPGTPITSGTQAVTFTAVDPAGYPFRELVTLSTTNSRTVAVTDDLVPIRPEVSHPEILYYAGFDIPEPGVFNGVADVGKKSISGVFNPDGSLLGVPANGGYADPPSGDAIRIIGDGKTILFTGLESGTFNQIAESTPHAGTEVTIKSILEIDGNGTDTFFLASRQGKGVTGADNLALQAVIGTGHHRILAKGDPITFADGTTKTVARFDSLAPSRATAADGRWRAGNSKIGALLTYTDHSQQIFLISDTSSHFHNIAETGTNFSIAGLEGTEIAGFGLPGFSDSTCAEIARLAIGKGGATASNDLALINSPGILIARKGGRAPDVSGAPMEDLYFRGFDDPVAGAGSAVAFQATLGGHGVTARNDTGIWYAADGVGAKLIARTGESMAAPGGGHWDRFLSMVLPDNTSRAEGPLFLATLAISKADGVTGRNNLGLWAVDGSGAVELLFRTGQSWLIDGKPEVVKTFTALAPAPGSTGAASGYTNGGAVAIRAKFEDGREALILLTAP